MSRKNTPSVVVPAKSKNLSCPACAALADPDDLWKVSVFKDASFPGFSYHKCPQCGTLFLSMFISEKGLTQAHRECWGQGKNFSFVYAPRKSPQERRDQWAEFSWNNLRASVCVMYI